VLKRLTIITLWLVLGFSKASAQYDATFSHYFDLEPTFNPAAVGKQPKLNITGAYAMSMAGFENNPRTMVLAADMPFAFAGMNHGAGVQLMNDQIGVFKHQRIALQYAYKLKLGSATLGLGLQGALLLENIDGTRLDPADANDHALPTSEETGNAVDLGVGLYYMARTWYVGLSAQHLNSPGVELGERHELHIAPTYYLTSGCNISLRNPFVKIKPSALVRTDGTGYRADISTRVEYTNEKRLLYAGVSYAPTISVTGMVGGRFHGIVLGYSYEMYTSAIKPGNGSHELFVGYEQELNFVKKGKNKHKSVRLL
jgi:bacteroidetes-specific putative membrane protein